MQRLLRSLERGGLAVCLILVTATVHAAEPELISVRKIWDEGPHNAFTDLVRFQDQWYCTFREGEGHVGGDGQIRVLVSRDGEKWESAALIAEEGIDLRDPKFSITRDNRLMIVAGGSVYGGTTVLKGRQPRVMFSTHGKQWSAPQRVLHDGEWLWRVIWHEGTAYGAAYNALLTDEQDWQLKLYKSQDGVEWELITPLEVPDRPNETTLRFLSTGEMMALVRREKGDTRGWIGTSRPPFREWQWNAIEQRLGGPNFIELPGDGLLAATRSYDDPRSTILAKMDRKSLAPLLTLPSGGDTSYAGLVLHDGLLWVSYYSSHEGKTSIYLAKVRL